MKQSAFDTLFLPTKKKAGRTTITYTVVENDGIYSLSVSSVGKIKESVFVEDIARDPVTAQHIKNLFANNTVFPLNVYEIFDDLLAI